MLPAHPVPRRAAPGLIQLLGLPQIQIATEAGAAGAHAGHGGALLALLFLPVALMIAVIAIDLLASRGWAPAEAFVSAYRTRSGLIKLLSLLMLMVAAIHLEAFELIGVFSKLIEVACLGLVVAVSTREVATLGFGRRRARVKTGRA